MQYCKADKVKFKGDMMRKREEFEISFETTEEKSKKSLWSSVYEWLDSPVYAVLLIFIIFTFFVRVVGVNGESMMPTLKHGDWLTVSAVTTEVERGDVVVVTQPNAINEPLIKRVIAKGGDTINIDFSTGTVTVNGEVQNEPYIAELTARKGDFKGETVIPEGMLFVMGDNRNNSLDSRFDTIGLIDERYVLGVAQVRIFPFGDWNINDYE